jgi:hypothetical protein
MPARKQSESILNLYNASGITIQRVKELVDTLGTIPSSKGRECLKKHYTGERITMSQMILAKCCECSAYYVDGKQDCEFVTCPLYYMMPYGKLRKPNYIRPDRLTTKE